MTIIEEVTELRTALETARSRDRIALVPTMGALHAGHLSLVEKAKRLADIVVVSIYVNPLQFGKDEDFSRYPRNMEEDHTLCKKAGVDFIFAPQSLYTDGKAELALNTHQMGRLLCGQNRPGHFDGVATVVNILFNIVQPHIAIFGDKDFQQLSILRRMVRSLHIPIEVLGSKTIREHDGLAMSSRNLYLNSEERIHAPHLYRTLQTLYNATCEGEKDCTRLIEAGQAYLRDAGIQAEYLEIRDESTLENTTHINTQPCRAFIAARIGNTRLIDNIPLEVPA